MDSGKKIFVIDLDGTICSHEKDYNLAKPYLDRISKINQLYDDGKTIIIDTARGSTTGIDWYDITETQLKSWGVKFHKLRVGQKLNADVFVDDKGINDKVFFKDI